MDGKRIQLRGKIDASEAGGLDKLEVFVDGIRVGPVSINEDGWSITATFKPYDDPAGDVPVRFVNEPDQSLSMVVVLATARNRRSDAKLLFI